jgi:hypothetical protein
MWLVLSLFPRKLRSDRFYILVAVLAFGCFVLVPEDIRASVLSLLDDVDVSNIGLDPESNTTSGY